jgi:hypothetical protein
MVHNNLRTGVHNYYEIPILIYFTHQSITYGIMEIIQIGIMSKLIMVNALVRRIHVSRCHVRIHPEAILQLMEEDGRRCCSMEEARCQTSLLLKEEGMDARRRCCLMETRGGSTRSGDSNHLRWSGGS